MTNDCSKPMGHRKQERRSAPRAARQVLLAPALVAASLFAGGVDVSQAGERSKRSEERFEEQAREQQQRQAEQQREEAERASQRQREQEQERQRAQQQVRSPENSESEKTTPQAAGNATANTEQPAANARDSQSRAQRDMRTRDRQPDNDRPPATVEEWVKRTFKSSAPETATGGAREDDRAQGRNEDTRERPGQTAPAPPGTAGASPAKPAAKTATVGKPAQRGRDGEIKFPDQMESDFLAVNLSKNALDSAKALGFAQKGKANLNSMSMSVTRLAPPPGMSVPDAMALLKEKAPDAGLGLNRTYRIYKTANGEPPDRVNAQQDAASSAPCTGDHCFGRELIGWRPQLQNCASGVKVGIIDTALDTTHPAFSEQKLHVGHFGTQQSAGPNWHGTGVTALLAGHPASGTPGLVPRASFYVADVFHAGADGQPASNTYAMLQALNWLESQSVAIVNLSLTGPPDDLVKSAISRMAQKGTLFVAAAGNDGPTAGPSYPAAYEDVLAVTAVDSKMRSYRYANRGDYIDVAAPGVSIWTALPGAKAGYHSGTSFAAPYVTAALAAMYPGLPVKSHADVLAHVSFKDLGDQGRDPVYGLGLLVAPSTCGAMAAASPLQGMAANGAPASAPAKETLPWLGLRGD